MKEKLRPGNEEILEVDVRMKSGGSNQVGWTNLLGWRGMLAPDARKKRKSPRKKVKKSPRKK